MQGMSFAFVLTILSVLLGLCHAFDVSAVPSSLPTLTIPGSIKQLTEKAEFHMDVYQEPEGIEDEEEEKKNG